MLKYLLSTLLLFSSLFFIACAGTFPEVSPNRKEALSNCLYALDTSMNPYEATMLSNEIFQEVAKLRQKFKPTSQPHFNNFLINAGVKEKGLCYEWSDALYLHFSKKEYLNFEFHLLVANQGQYFYEHNTLVVVAKGGEVLKGIVIDPWRDPEKLYFSKVSEDKQYEWKHREKRGCQNGK